MFSNTLSYNPSDSLEVSWVLDIGIMQYVSSQITAFIPLKKPSVIVVSGLMVVSLNLAARALLMNLIDSFTLPSSVSSSTY